MTNSMRHTRRIALKTATEYPLPANQQTHEIVSPAEGTAGSSPAAPL